MLLQGGAIHAAIDEQIVYDLLDADEPQYKLVLTNQEVRKMFRTMVRGWFRKSRPDYNDFNKALLMGDVKAMNFYMNRVALQTFSYFDTGKTPSVEEPERLHSVKATTKGLTEPNPSVCFYHGFVLGLVVELADQYVLTSNQESGFGRYDVMLEPKDSKADAILLEFKVQDSEDEKELSDTVSAALAQIERKNYEALLIGKGFAKGQIRKYGFAFRGKEVLIGERSEDGVSRCW